jgi:cytochrome P450/ferredoxin-NADP reductase
MNAPGALHSSSYDVDLYSDEVILDPYDHYRAIRELGSVVYLPKHNLWAMSRHADVKAALLNHELFSSAKGVAANDVLNTAGLGNTITSDPPDHTRMRSIIREPLTVPALRKISPSVKDEAEAVVERLVRLGEFEVMSELAQYLPVTIVSRLVGLPEEGRGNMLKWAGATFDALGPMNGRAQAAMPKIEELHAYCRNPATIGSLRPDGWAAAIWRAAERGDIPRDKCPAMMRDYISPSLDTTIFATGNIVRAFARFPDQWDLVRRDWSLISGAINEGIRWESPVRGFTRVLTRDAEFDGVELPAGTRMLLLYASANRDERAWKSPEIFDVRRDTRDHIGFGFGPHICVGMHLARLEITCLLQALAKRVTRFVIRDEQWGINNALRGLKTMHVEVMTGEDREAKRDQPISLAEPLNHLAVTVAGIVEVAKDIWLVTLRSANGSPLPEASPGAHIDVHLPNGLTRQYSVVLGKGGAGRIQIGVKREHAGLGGSAFIFEKLRVGDDIRISGPRNNFPLVEIARNSVFIAGGIGVTPIISMKRRAAQLGLTHRLYFAARAESEVAFLDELSGDPNVHLHIDEEAGSVLDLASIEAGAPVDTHFYCCGPKPMMQAFERIFAVRPKECVHLEYFSARHEAARSGGFDVELAGSGRIVRVEPGERIVDALRRVGVEVPVSCEQGVCGSCETQVVAGEPDHRDSVLSAEEKAANKSMMVCCGGCKGDRLVLDL